MPISKIKGNGIEDDSITSARLDDGTIVAVDLASDAVTTAKIAADAVTTAKIAADAVDGTKIADDSIDSEHIADGAVDLSHMSATGTKDATTFLRGDNSFQVVAVTPTAVSDQANTSTGSFSFPSGTEAQRPGSPTEGMTRYNSDSDKLEVYANGAWERIDSAPTYDVDYLVVAGGGSGGTAGGGGGAGGMREGTLTLSKGTTYTVTIGGGGAGVSSWGAGGNAGGDSVFGSITSLGGGLGGHGGGGDGGSGGGGAQGLGGSGTAGQGNDGGDGSFGNPGLPGGGGGGKSAAGADASGGSTAGAGGNGLANAITSAVFAGGGGGGTRSGTAGAGGSGGGGAGSSNSNGTSGTTNTGGGGGGAGGANIGTVSGNGGSGIVIIKVPDANYATSTLTGSPSSSQSGGFTTLTWTQSGSYTAQEKQIMAHYAKIQNGKVVDIIVASQEHIDNMVDTSPGKWIQTSYNTYGGVHSDGGTPLRKNYAGIGFTYDKTRDAFIPPKPYASWTLDEDTCLWEPPVAHPDDGEIYDWNEETQTWDAVE